MQEAKHTIGRHSKQLCTRQLAASKFTLKSDKKCTLAALHANAEQAVSMCGMMPNCWLRPQLVQFVNIRVNSILFFSQRLASGQLFDPTYTFTYVQPADGMADPVKSSYVDIVRKDFDQLKLEYKTLL
jgi:hypothetical protein